MSDKKIELGDIIEFNHTNWANRFGFAGRKAVLISFLKFGMSHPAVRNINEDQDHKRHCDLSRHKHLG